MRKTFLVIQCLDLVSFVVTFSLPQMVPLCQLEELGGCHIFFITLGYFEDLNYVIRVDVYWSDVCVCVCVCSCCGTCGTAGYT